MNKWDRRFMGMCDHVAEWSSCIRRQIGAVTVKDRRIMTTGYNGAPAGCRTCVERNFCMRQEIGIPSGEKTEVCYAVHAEQNAIAQAAKLGISLEGATMYCTHQPCSTCAKLMINAGIERVVYRDEYPDDFGMRMLEQAHIAIERAENV